MLHLADHAAHGSGVSCSSRVRCILLSPRPDQRRALLARAADRAADLGDLDRSCRPSCRSPRASASPARPRGGRGCRRPSCRGGVATGAAALSCFSASKVALIMLCGFDVPTDFATTSCTPSVSKTARIGPPAMMPVPGRAARITTLPAPKWPCDVVVQRAALAQRHADHAALGLLGRLADRLGHLARLAGAVADAALAWSPTTTSAAKPKRLPPFTTLATRLIATSLSTNSPSSRSRSRRAPLALRAALAAICLPCLPSPQNCQAALAGGVGQRLDPAVIEIAAAVENDLLDPGGLGALGDQLADLLRRLLVGAGLQLALQLLVERRGGGQGRPFASSMTWA